MTYLENELPGNFQFPLTLESVHYFHDNVLNETEIVQFDFLTTEKDVLSFFIAVDQEFDSILISWEPPNDMGECVRAALPSFWQNAVGKKLVWIWVLTNQQNYFDAIQFEFQGDKGDEECIIQFLAIGSAIKTYKLERC